MKEYLISVIVVSFVAAFASFIAYPSALEKSARCAVMTVVIAVSLSPIVLAVKNIKGFDANDFVSEDLFFGEDFEGEYLKVAEKAFSNGIKRLLYERFEISESDSAVAVIGFDFENMNAEKIKITLSGRAVFADYRRIEEYIEKNGLGECEVNVSFGK